VCNVSKRRILPALTSSWILYEKNRKRTKYRRVRVYQNLGLCFPYRLHISSRLRSASPLSKICLVRLYANLPQTKWEHSNHPCTYVSLQVCQQLYVVSVPVFSSLRTRLPELSKVLSHEISFERKLSLLFVEGMLLDYVSYNLIYCRLKTLTNIWYSSASILDILLDIQVQLVPFLSPGVSAPHGVRVHAGFLTAWNSVSVQVLTILTEQLALHKDIEKIITTGHSLGGCLATLSAMSTKQHFPRCQVMTYSYGAPRTGNKIFAEFFNENFGENAFRVVHTHDGVPTMLSQSLGYHHHGIEYWQVEEPACAENIIRCEAHGEDPSCSSSIPSTGVNDAHLTYLGIVATRPFCL
jgi:hypothetical protein